MSEFMVIVLLYMGVRIFLLNDVSKRTRSLEQEIMQIKLRLNSLLPSSRAAPEETENTRGSVPSYTYREDIPARAIEVKKPEMKAPPAVTSPPDTAPYTNEEPFFTRLKHQAEKTGSAAPAFGMEQLFGGKLFVWVGGVALALAAIFLVQYSIAQGWLQPPVRVGLGLAFGATLILIALQLDAVYALIRQIVAGAGIFALYASFFAGSALYHFWPSEIALLLLSLTTVTAVALSGKLGAQLAMIGLAGGYLTPLLIGSTEPNALGLFGYLLVLSVGLSEIGLRRQWPYFAVPSAIGGIFWLLLYCVFGNAGADVPVLAGFLLLSSLWQVGVLLRLHALPLPSWDMEKTNAGIGAVMALSSLGLIAVVARGQYSLLCGGLALLLIGGFFLLTRWRQLDTNHYLIPTAAAGILALLWPGAEFSSFLIFSSGTILIATLSGWGAKTPSSWMIASSILSVVFSATAYACWGDFGSRWSLAAIHVLPTLTWGYMALGMAVFHAMIALATARQYGRDDPDYQDFIGGYIALSNAFIAAALAIFFDQQVFLIAASIHAVALVLLSERFEGKVLRPFACALGILVTFVLGTDIFAAPGRGFIDLAVRYALPASLFAFAALRLQRAKSSWHAETFELLSPYLFLIWGYFSIQLLVKNLFPADVQAGWQTGFMLTSALAMGLFCLRISRSTGRLMLRRVGQFLGYGSLLVLIFAFCLFGNPLWSGMAVGATPGANALLFLYALPALLTALMARELAFTGSQDSRFVFHGISLALLLQFSVATIRQFFHGAVLLGPASPTELYTHSAALIFLAFALFGAGIASGSRFLRLGALVYMTIGTIKVFLWDMGGLEGLWRVVTFLGLGISLIVIGFLYQRFALIKAKE